MIKYFLGIVAIIILIGGLVYFLENKAPKQMPASAALPVEQVSVQAATSTYATSTFSVVYPSDFSVDENFANIEVSSKKPIGGVKFTIPQSMATGTDLAADTFASVEELPRAKICTGDIYLKQNVKAVPITDNGVAYSLATTSQTSAGNTTEEYVYALAGSSPCTAVRYFIHSIDTAPPSQGSVQPFDSAKLMGAFDSIRRSLSLKTIIGTAAPAGTTLKSAKPGKAAR